jgi:hypothetical protein
MAQKQTDPQHFFPMTQYFFVTLNHLFHVASPLGVDALAVITAELGVGFAYSGGTVQLI